MKGRRNERKTVAALEAAKRLRDGQIVGLGSGSTVAAFLPIAAETIKEKSMDLFFVFIWYDVSLFPMYPLIAIWGTTRKEYAAMKLFLYLLAGSAMVLPAIIYLT